MKVLVIGLGSMGQRRIRNIKAIGGIEICGFDLRQDRRELAATNYEVGTFETLERAIHEFKPSAFIISTPPDQHMYYANIGFENGIHCFIEASVTDVQEIENLNNKVKTSNIVMAPSCTMKYFPGPRKVKELLESKIIGDILTINYQTGQYLPDWHPWENVKEYYVSNRETGGAREIVPFELTWLNALLGTPKPINCIKRKLSDMEVDIDDYYQFTLVYQQGIVANFQIEVLSRPMATRELRILGSQGQIVLSNDTQSVRVTTTQMNTWKSFPIGTGTIEKNYINPEEPYIEELLDFFKAVKCADQKLFPNTLDSDIRILNLLLQLEGLSDERI